MNASNFPHIVYIIATYFSLLQLFSAYILVAESNAKVSKDILLERHKLCWWKEHEIEYIAWKRNMYSNIEYTRCKLILKA